MGRKDLILIAVLYGSLVLGALLPSYSSLVAPSIKYWMMAMLFLSFIKIAPNDVRRSLARNPINLLLGCVIRLIAAPAAAYWITNLLYPELALSMLLLAGVSTGVSSPFFVSLCKGDISFALVMAVMTSLLVPLSLPAMVKFMAGAKLNYDLFSMALFLAVIVFIPLISAFSLRAVAPGILRRVNARAYPISLVVIAMINFGALGRYVPYLKANPDQILLCIILSSGLAVCLALIGWLVSMQKTWSEKVASSGSQTWLNNVLIIALAVHLDNSLAAVLSAAYFLPLYGSVVLFSVMASRRCAPRFPEAPCAIPGR